MDFQTSAIYYGDRSIYRGRPEDAPNQNVQGIIIPPIKPTTADAFYRHRLISECDLYVYDDAAGGWLGIEACREKTKEGKCRCQFHDLMRHIRANGCGVGGVRAVLEGLGIERDLYLDIIHKAQRDHDMPERDS